MGVGSVEELDGMGEVLRQNHLAKIANESNLRQVAVYRSDISLFGQEDYRLLIYSNAKESMILSRYGRGLFVSA